MSYRIPFNRPCLAGSEYKYIAEAIAGGHASGDGPFTRKCHEILEKELGAAKVLLTTSCTHALEMAALLLECGPDDEVIVPSFTFVSTANAFALRGSKLVFADIRPDTLNLDDNRLESLITSKTKAIVVVHYAGVPCEMDSILAIASRHGIRVVEDNAHGLFSKYKGAYTGTMGCLATQSFHETKNFTCGEGGALVINDAALEERALVIREKGTNRSRFFRGEVDKYSWVDLGSSYLPSDLLAAFLYAQLEAKEQIQQKRRGVWNRYYESLAGWAESNDVRLPVIPPECEQAHHMFYVLLPSIEHREWLIAHLKSQGMLSVFHYSPLHLSEAGKRFAARESHCPITEDISERLLRLPFYNDLGENEQDQVIAAVKNLRVRQRSVA
ncbi:MAG TPA: dTDP-4-amino-4,6-dideoxygalactose transaminase [Terriglobales bacterium]|jgi:dTDP-4-amino-4,6-dideoxygalactose transaminase|nr:dTDP-4-amino-4,6-dideoxygalactose transaminase [Terriglobales bacterium]